MVIRFPCLLDQLFDRFLLYLRPWWTCIWFFRWGIEALMECYLRHVPRVFGSWLPVLSSHTFRADSVLTDVWCIWVLKWWPGWWCQETNDFLSPFGSVAPHVYVDLVFMLHPTALEPLVRPVLLGPVVLSCLTDLLGSPKLLCFWVLWFFQCSLVRDIFFMVWTQGGFLGMGMVCLTLVLIFTF